MNSTSPEIDYTTPGNGTTGRAPTPAPHGVPGWKQELNERLAATRARRHAKPAEQTALPGLEHMQSKAESRAARLAAKVAERYSQAPSYSEMLAMEARVVARAAEAAESAAQQARAAAQAILAGLDMPQHLDGQAAEEAAAPAPAPAYEQRAQPAPPGNTYRGHEEFAYRTNREPHPEPASAEDLLEDPFEEALVMPAEPLPANLIEFPRELVAARKARPRLAEGPLRESEEAQAEPQLRIFEVASGSISTTARADARMPEWSSIRLDARSAYAPAHEAAQAAGRARPADARENDAHANLDLPLETAPLEDRLMASIVDLALVGIGFVLFVVVFAACTAHPPTGKPALIGAGLVLAGLFLLYQVLFFTYSEGTPGMRYAKIALCTFNDENPTRKAMRRRILPMLLSACPLGLGFAWAWFDTDRLGWHDRLTRMYQRSYR